KSFATCKAKFANGVNFRGFPHLPGNDAAYAYVNSTNDYDGGVLVP
ncbi:phage BR0599 family protein, partial [Brucella melitensis]